MRQHYQKRVQKVPLDAGFDCPNRDGSLSGQGCIFCNPAGSGTALAEQGIDLRTQYMQWRDILQKKYKAQLFWAYLQSFSNTYGPREKLLQALEQLQGLPGLVGLCVGTRPDCVDQDKLKILADFGLQDIWLELGLQSAQDKTLALINRGHSSAVFEQACDQAAGLGLKVCAHLVLGLPGEVLQDVKKSIEFINQLPVHGVKLHNLYVCRGAVLESWWRQGHYEPLSRETFLQWLARAISLLRSDIVLHRINADPAPGELLAPDWADRKQELLQEIHVLLAKNNLWQGKYWDAPANIPNWF